MFIVPISVYAYTDGRRAGLGSNWTCLTIALNDGVHLLELELITTGGTIDGADLDVGSLRPTSDTAEWLRHQPGLKLSVNPLFNKDSREITNDDRRILLDAVRATPVERVLISHGTFTIAKTARMLKSELEGTGKTILLVGAWIPFNSYGSDASAQMQFALAVLKDGPVGVWIAMDGRLWNPDVTLKVQDVRGGFKLVEVNAEQARLED